MLSNKVYYVKYRTVYDNFIHEKGALYGEPLGFFTLQDLNRDVADGYITIIEFKEVD